MASNWAEKFYEMQYRSLKQEGELTVYEMDLAKSLKEQVGRPLGNVLELGAWDGRLARILADDADTITTVELIPEMVEVAKAHSAPNITPLCGDFYDIKIDSTFDTILYMDGFGVGEDEDQRTLLERIGSWLNDNGTALIDIYNPTHWIKADGQSMCPNPVDHPEVIRRYDYDYDNNRMIDTWWHADEPENTLSQYLKCYTTEQIYTLCQAAGLDVIGYFPNGAMDYNAWQYSDNASLEECLSYRIKVRRH
ncbi:class I SAM-dependent methyltransferase [Salinicoccus sp. ID82-1]|uniref:Class I SAM-dependent methyltransferase n=1 Tax=Salinicoccus cyprini TaxID=2493691 RepID=A0A558AV09_9STAP|nr:MULTISPECIES: class I SAM-dependent methyltransferase [Salinicoccus]MCG1010524.1 class I SAM-dependent methyltransferase [Salinicoccus sp. ID82-1]TVT28107.1 class I SAM-dependent methyltransferase [Salinicoccus cyprini]